MTPIEEHQVRQRQEDLELMQSPTRWPLWPLLPLVRRGKDIFRDPGALGFLVDPAGLSEKTRESAPAPVRDKLATTVFLGSISELEVIRLSDQKRWQLFDSYEAILDAGWKVD